MKDYNMATLKNILSLLAAVALMLSVFFMTSFVNFPRKHVPFILRLSQNGSNKVTAILDSTKSVQMRSGFVTLRPGEDVGSHNTGEHEELLIILSGKGKAEIGGFGKKEIEKGMAVYVPPNNQHDIFCSGSYPLQYIYIVAPTK